jgi:hypothetical protein
VAPAPRPARALPQAVTGSALSVLGYASQRRTVTAAADAVMRRPGNALGLAASAIRMTRQDSDMARRVIQGWQTRSFLYYEQCGEIWYAAQFYARALAKLELSVKRLDPAAPTGGEEDVDVASVQDYVTRIQDPGGGRANLLGAYGRLMFLTGEGYMLCTNPRDPYADSGIAGGDADEGGMVDIGDEGGDDSDVEALTVEEEADYESEVWEFLSTDELRADGDGSFTRYQAPSLGANEVDAENDEGVWEPLPGKAIAYRFWRRHPRYSALADAPMRGVLDLCEELLILTMAVRARAVSRVAGAGILAVPEEISPAPPKPAGDENPVEDPFLSDLTEAMVTPIKDQGTASAVVPFVVRGQAEYLDKLRLITMSDPDKFYPETGLRTECIRRIAIGLDMPPEALIGTEDANHWTAWSIDEQTWKAHLQPIAQMLCDDLTSAYLRPAMAADGVANPEQYVVAYDASAVINHPDRTKDAKDLWDRLAISDEELREANGFPEDSAPDEAEWLRRAGFLMRDSSMAAYGIPSVRANIEPDPGQIEGAPQAGGLSPAPSAEGSPPSAKTPAESAGTAAPAQPTEQQASPPHPPTTASAYGAEVAGAVSVAVQRCREKAGARLRSQCAGIPDAAALIDGVPNVLVAAGLGRDRVSSVMPGTPARELVRGGAAPLIAALVDHGMTRSEATTLAQAAERHAAQTLFVKSPSPLQLDG